MERQIQRYNDALNVCEDVNVMTSDAASWKKQMLKSALVQRPSRTDVNPYGMKSLEQMRTATSSATKHDRLRTGAGRNGGKVLTSVSPLPVKWSYDF